MDNSERFVTINTGYLIDKKQIAAAVWGHFWTVDAGGPHESAIPKFIDAMLEDYELEKDLKTIQELSKLDLNDYDQVVLIRLNSDRYDPFSTGKFNRTHA